MDSMWENRASSGFDVSANGGKSVRMRWRRWEKGESSKGCRQGSHDTTHLVIEQHQIEGVDPDDDLNILHLNVFLRSV